MNTAEAPKEFHNLMRFNAQCNIYYPMIEAPVLHREVVEEIWITVVYNSTDKVNTFSLKGSSYSINSDVLSSCLRIHVKTHSKSPTETNIRTTLEKINYVIPDANLGKIVRKNIRKEWSYLFDNQGLFRQAK